MVSRSILSCCAMAGERGCIDGMVGSHDSCSAGRATRRDRTDGICSRSTSCSRVNTEDAFDPIGPVNEGIPLLCLELPDFKESAQ